jgi:enoyl-[acyl-carrier-protein] reductase (NADH)
MVATDAARTRLEREVPMPLNGIGTPKQVGALLGWLTSPANELVTGQVIFIDGGYEALVRGDVV